VPVTARLSKAFYDRIGEQATNELVDWFNQVDATYRADLQQLNDVNFARFDAKLEQRVAESTAKLEQRLAESVARLDARIDRLAAELNAKIDRLEADLNAKIGGLAVELNAKIDRLESRLEARIDRMFNEQMRWLFAAWVTLLIPILGFGLR
jgi:outer membrane murein-binding lipoprotein Lpp